MSNQNVIGNAVITVGADASPFQSEVQSQTGGAVKSVGKRFGGALTTALKGGAIAAGAAVTGVLAASMAKGMGRLTAIENAKSTLEGLGHSAENVQSIMDSALASVKGTAFGLDEAATLAATAVAAGVKPGADLTRTLKVIADTASIANTSLADLSDVFGDVFANGKVTNVELGRLAERGIPAAALMAKHLGVSMSEVPKLVKEGKVSIDDFTTALEKGFGGAALKSGDTFQGAMRNVGAAMSRLGAGLLGGVFEQMPAVFADVIKLVDNLTPAATNLGKVLGKAFSTAYSALRGLFDLFVKGDFTGTFRDAFGVEEDSPLVNFLFNIREAAMRMFAGLKEVWDKVGPLISKAMQEIGPVVGNVLGSLGPVLMRVGELMMEAFAKAGPLIVDVFKSMWPVVKRVGQVLSEVFTAAAPLLMRLAEIVYRDLVPAIIEFARWMWERLAPVFVVVVEAVRNFLSALQPVAAYIIGTLLPAFVATVKEVLENLKPAFEAAMQVIRDQLIPTFNKMVAKFKELWPKIKVVVDWMAQFAMIVAKVASWIIGKLLPPLLKAAAWLVDKLAVGIWGAIEGFLEFLAVGARVGKWFVDLGAKVAEGVKKAWQKVKDFIDDVKNLGWKTALLNAGKDLVRGLWNGIKGLGGWIKEKVGGWITENIPDVVKRILKMGSPSKVMAQQGRWTVEGLAKGMQDSERLLSKQARTLAVTMQSDLPSARTMRPGGSTTNVTRSAVIHNHYPKPETATQGMAMGIRLAQLAMG